MLESKRERALAVTRSGKRRLGGADLDEKGNLFTRLALPPLDSDQPNLPSHRFHTPTFLYSCGPGLASFQRPIERSPSGERI